jgi:HSP20 family protein
MALEKRGHRPVLNVFEDMFDRWPERFGWPWLSRSEAFQDILRVEEYQENGTLVVRAEMGGIDPDKDVEVTVSDGMLHISAERREEEETEGKQFHRRELRYGSFHRDLPLPAGCSEDDIKASYKDGILEIRVPAPSAEAKAATKVSITKG